MKKENLEWIMTDADQFQIRRRVHDDVYEFYAIAQIITPNQLGAQCFKVAHEVIFLSEIDPGFVLNTYDNDSLEKLIDNCGEGWNDVLMDCAFELSIGTGDNILQSPLMTWEEAKKLICGLSGYAEQMPDEG